MKEREATILPPGKFRLTGALERLVQLYDAWGKPDEAAQWRRQMTAQLEAEKKDQKPLKQP